MGLLLEEHKSQVGTEQGSWVPYNAERKNLQCLEHNGSYLRAQLLGAAGRCRAAETMMKGGWQSSRAERSLGPETTGLREKQHADYSQGAILKYCGRLVPARVSTGKRMKKAWYIHTWSVSLT